MPASSWPVVRRCCWIVLTLLVSAGCHPAKRPTPPVLASELAAELGGNMAAVGAVPWSGPHQLAWADFRGLAPTTGSEGAQTAYSLFYGFRCAGATLAFKVTAAFQPGESWVKPAVLADPDRSRRTLRHEQTHFNLSEVHARRMRRYFAGVFEPCAGDAEERLRTPAARFIAEEAAAQQAYDAETRHGLLERAQLNWDRRVDDQLASLAAFAD